MIARVDPAAAREVAAAYLGTPSRPCPVVAAAYARLVVESDRLFRHLTAPDRPDRHHPVMGNEIGGAYDRFRAVHDVIGHARLRLGFDRDGEFAVWRSQERFHSPLARRALATELHGQHSLRWTTGEVAQPKAILLDRRLLRRSVTAALHPVPVQQHQRKAHHETRRHRR